MTPIQHITDPIEIIRNFYSEVLSWAIDNDMSLANICIFVHPNIADALKLVSTLSIEHNGSTRDVPIIKSTKFCQEIALENGGFETDIAIGDPDWKQTCP